MFRIAVLVQVAFLISVALPTTAAYWQPFVTFLPSYDLYFVPDKRQQCATQVAESYQRDAWCENILNCWQNATEEYLKSNMAGASILLGLAGTFLGASAPAIEDLILLGTQRPLLAFLAALSTPSLRVPSSLASDANPVKLVLNRMHLTGKSDGSRKGAQYSP